jgi:hypothetical protein
MTLGRSGDQERVFLDLLAQIIIDSIDNIL